MPDILEPDNTIAITRESGKMFDDFSDWAASVSRELNFQSTATGSGSPEAVLVADITKQYMDTAGTAGSILYIKRDADIAGDRSKGWILV